ncbi:S-layer homology domain-containing protein [Pseudobacillus badius]|uniref:S-layer homology domain-containing protein n=1 Tax=Bacillus badius TaxID=1455 RepID=UPI0007BBC507|nr:S-layer homology domain-containing protein [Bacillus badius]KZR57553.1 hypothetical protein A3781_01855 [Bacillus badius]
MAYQPKSYRKFVATAATATLVATAVTPAFAAETNFTDATGQYKEAINYVVEKEIAKGISKDKFGTFNPITRGDAAVMIAKAIGLDTTKAPDSGFKDLNSRVKGAVDALFEKKIISGKSKTEFKPNDKITRQEMAKILVNAYDLKSTGEKNEFKDVNSNFAQYVDALVSNGITKGIDSKTFGSLQDVTRGQFAIFVHRADHPAPKVEVSAVKVADDKTLEVTLKEAKEGLKAEDFKVAVDGAAVKASKVEADEKGSVYKLTIDSLNNKAGKVTVNGVEASYDFTAAKVTSVMAINATQVEVKFNTPVDKATLFEDNGNFKVANLTFTALDNQDAPVSTTKATLSEDGKTLVVTASKKLEKRYKIVIDNVKDKKGEAVAKFDDVVNVAADVKAPTIVGTEKLNATQVKVKFSEPIKTLGDVTFKNTDGTTVTGVTEVTTFQAGDSSVTYNLSANTVPVGKEITATFVGLQDQADNVISPNPASVTLQKGDKDGVAPTVSGITQTGGKKFTIKFSEAVQKPAVADITVNGTAVTAVESVGTDSTTFEFTTAAFLDGAMTVASANPITDLSGETATFSKVVSFVKDEVAPKVTSTVVSKDANDGKEYLEITFDKDVELSTTAGSESKLSATGAYVDNYITKDITAAGTNNNIDYKVASNKKVVRVELATFLGTTDVKGAVYDLDLTFANVESAAGAAVTTGKAKFTRGEDGPGTSTDVVDVKTVAKGSTNDKVEVTFDKAVDGASATNPANYTVDGAVVESVSLAAASGGTQVATLNLKKDSNTFSGTRNVTIQNVKALNSNKVMEKTVKPVNLDENVRPTVTKAELTATDKITLTFSEAVLNADDTKGADFALVVGGSTSVKTLAAEVVAAGSAKNTLVLTVSSDIDATEIAKGISIKPLSTVNIKDVKGNDLNTGTITVK